MYITLGPTCENWIILFRGQEEVLLMSSLNTQWPSLVYNSLDFLKPLNCLTFCPISCRKDWASNG